MMEDAVLGPRVIVALDYPRRAEAMELVTRLDPVSCRLKVGKELFVRAGPVFVEELISRGFDVFLDLKFHDIPNTVAQACKVAADLGVWMVNVHTLAGRAAMSAAREAISGCHHRPLLIGVTVLTSHGADALVELGFTLPPAVLAERLAKLARLCGLDGVVCSAREAVALRRELGSGCCLVTPGIRPAGTPLDDQHRVMTPAEAIAAGATYLVIGRPITRAEDPLAVLRAIAAEIEPLQQR
jgi:orotidine-5'-phosphate decarboxylase